MDKKSLSERDICTKYITPALEKNGWDKLTQIREEVTFTDGKIYVRGVLTSRGNRKRADYILYYKPNIPVAIIEAKDNNHSLRSGIQQALDYARVLDIPSVFSSNGDGFLFHDRTAAGSDIETELGMDDFPAPAVLWEKYKKYKGIKTPEEERIAAQDYFFDGSGRKPRYYQQIAINRTVEAIASGQQRILLGMATGTGKTYTAFQIIHRLWKAGVKKRILFLADRNALIDQTRRGDFKHFRDKMTVVKNRKVDKSYEIYLALYQGLSGSEEESNIYKQFSCDFFDLIVVDECHRGSARADSAWREILDYFTNATQIGLTATPRETKSISNIEYFGDPVYIYSLRQGVDDGFLAPYKVLRIGINVDINGWEPEKGKLDKNGNPVPERKYNLKDYERVLIIEERTELAAKMITDYLKGYDRFAKTIVFCTDIDHASRMRHELVKLNGDLMAENSKYIMQITGDNDEGKRELDNFINPAERFPVIATTSELMTTGIDAQTCRVIVLECNIQSMTKFKQIIGRGTRINEDYDKKYFTIIDFRNATNLFADKEFDGPPIRIKTVAPDESVYGFESENNDDADAPWDDPTIPPPDEGIEDKSGEPYITGPEPPHEKEQKTTVNGVNVFPLYIRKQYFDNDNKPITVSLSDHTKQIIKGHFASLDDFLNKWNAAERKEAVIAELKQQGVLVDALIESLERKFDLFDLICHVAYDMPPLTRKERANNVKKRNYFTKYGEQARKVLEALIDKYADEGIKNVEDITILQVNPFTQFGSAYEILRNFGGTENYLTAIKELEKELYKTA